MTQVTFGCQTILSSGFDLRGRDSTTSNLFISSHELFKDINKCPVFTGWLLDRGVIPAGRTKRRMDVNCMLKQPVHVPHQDIIDMRSLHSTMAKGRAGPFLSKCVTQSWPQQTKS